MAACPACWPESFSLPCLLERQAAQLLTLTPTLALALSPNPHPEPLPPRPQDLLLLERQAAQLLQQAAQAAAGGTAGQGQAGTEGLAAPRHIHGLPPGAAALSR